MNKRAVSAALTAAILLSCTGCGSIFEKEYISVSDYQADSGETAYNQSDEIHYYTKLESAIGSLVRAGQQQGRLNLAGYDGDVEEDLGKACRTVSRETAMGEWCIDYMSYSLRQIVSYYEADIYITYSRTEEQIDSLEIAVNITQIKKHISNALRSGREYLAIRLTTAVADSSSVEGYILAAAKEQGIVLDSYSVNEFGSGGLERIFEIELVYGG